MSLNLIPTLRLRGGLLKITKKINSVFIADEIFSLSRNMATLRNKRKLAAVSREAPEGSRSSRGRNVLDPELTQDYISQVSEEIEGRVTKKLSKEFNKTESRILGALSKLDEFLLNPQMRTCSVVQEASRNTNSENRETHGDRSSNDPYPEGGYFPHHSGQLNSSEADMVTETYPHSNTKKMCFKVLKVMMERPTVRLLTMDQRLHPFSLQNYDAVTLITSECANLFFFHTPNGLSRYKRIMKSYLYLYFRARSFVWSTVDDAFKEKISLQN